MTENAPTYTAEELARIEEFEAPYLQKIAERGNKIFCYLSD